MLLFVVFETKVPVPVTSSAAEPWVGVSSPMELATLDVC